MPENEMPVEEVRQRVALALDVGDLAAAEAVARRLAPWFGIAKVGMELYAEAGPEALDRMHELGFRVFADLKLYDIPTTVERAARALGRRGVEFLNFATYPHGEGMLRAGVAGLLEGARDGGHPEPVPLAVTVLTSDPRTETFEERLDAAAAAGCRGVVCSAYEVEAVHARRADLATMVPGMRLPGGDHHDQARVATPAEAVRAGADWMVVGRAVTAATDAEAAATAVARSIADALGARTRDT
ncbi:MAG: orotidine-5'-phosphate decarboxylase [Acidimicrobiia bacterium]